MKPWVLGCVAAGVFVACGADESSVSTVSTTGTIEFSSVEGGVWLIRADNGKLYNPRNLPDGFKVVDAHVQVTLIERPDIVSVGGVGVVADIVRISQFTASALPAANQHERTTLHHCGCKAQPVRAVAHVPTSAWHGGQPALRVV